MGLRESKGGPYASEATLRLAEPRARSGQAASTASAASRPYGERSEPPLRERSERPYRGCEVSRGPYRGVRSLPRPLPRGAKSARGPSRGSYASEASALTHAAAVSITSTKAGSCFAFPPGTLNE